jgi:FkbM family methyltransferase
LRRFATKTREAFAPRRILRPLLSAIQERVLRDRLLAEDIVPYGVHRFSRKTWVIKETELGLRIWCSLDDRAISRPVLVDAYELRETRFIASALQPGDLAVDAGANIGYYTLLFAKLVGESGAVEAFEPLPYLADALGASVKENGFESRVRVHRLALDERAEVHALRHAPRTANFGGAHLSPNSALPVDHVDETVSTVRLDDVLRGRKCRLLKIDVEGAEPRVIRGARATIAIGRPVILSELHDPQLRAVSRCNATDFIAQLAALDYTCSLLHRDGTRGHAITRYGDRAPTNVVFDPAGV